MPKQVLKIRLEHRFTRLNEYINAERTNKYAGAVIKQTETRMVQLMFHGVEPIETYPVEMEFQWHCKDKRSDPDNIAFAVKFILDGMVMASILENDGWQQIKSIKHGFSLAKEDFVVVTASVD